MIKDWSAVTDKTLLRVAFYARVSSEKEAQLSAFENQLTWCEELLDKNPNWTKVNTYTDRGFSGTQAENRPGFMQMIQDAFQDTFDLVVTREISRFGRNVEDILKYNRELREHNVQVFFVNDNFKSIENKSDEISFLLKAFNAQQESKKISDRAKEGQKQARRKGVLYGNGNILGYERIRKASDYDKKDHIGDKSLPTFKINESQAETVRRIFELYKDGVGLKKIKNQLMKEERKNSSGQVKWYESSISRMLDNPMYIGKQYQCKTTVDDYISHKTIKNDKSQYVLIEGDFEPIISQELFDAVQALKKSKHTYFEGAVYGKKISKDKWLDKLECTCGSRFQEYVWRHNKKTGEVIKGYACRHRTVSGSTKFRQINGIIGDDITCNLRALPEWKFEYMGLKIFSGIWGDKKESVLSTFDHIVKNYSSAKSCTSKKLNNLESQLKRYKGKQKTLIEMRTDNDISKEEYRITKEKYNNEIESLKKEISILQSQQDVNSDIKDLEVIKNVLSRFVDFNGEKISGDIVKSFVDRVIVNTENSFDWLINLSGDAEKFILQHGSHTTNTPYNLRAQKTADLLGSRYELLFTLYLNFEDALAFKKKFGKYIRTNQWEDILVKVYVRVK